jgi:hypothetical protein
MESVGPVEEDSGLTILQEDEPHTSTITAHNGEEGQITRGKGALSFRLGDFYSGKDTEQMRLTEEGNLGIGMKDPQAKLDVDGFIRATQGIVFPDGSIQFSASRKTYGPQSAGPGQFGKNPSSGREHFEIAAAGTGTQNFIAKWTESGGAGTLGDSIIFDNGTNVGIGTSTPAKKLDVRGGQLALDNSRFLYSRRTNGQFQEAFGIDSNDDIIFNRNSLVPGVDLDAPKASSALIFGTGAGKFFDIRSSANVPLLRIFEATGNVGIGTSNPLARLQVASAGNGVTSYTARFQSNPSVAGAGGILFDQNSTYGWKVHTEATGFTTGMLNFNYVNIADGSVQAANTLVLRGNGNVGIGVTNPTARLQVEAGNGVGILANSQTNAVIGYSTGQGFAAVYGESQNGNGYGVYGRNAFGGFAMLAEGNAGQSRNKGGWVKALLKVSAAGAIERCYNAITGAAGGTCGFSVTSYAPDFPGFFDINFGFKVNDRFASVTADYVYSSVAASVVYGEGNENTIRVVMCCGGQGFTIIVY